MGVHPGYVGMCTMVGVLPVHIGRYTMVGIHASLVYTPLCLPGYTSPPTTVLCYTAPSCTRLGVTRRSPGLKNGKQPG